MFGMMRKKLEIPPPEQCLPGRAIKMPVPPRHFVNGNALEGINAFLEKRPPHYK